VHVQQLELQSRPVGELKGLLSRLRWQLAGERVAILALRGAIGSSLLLIALLVGTWLGLPRMFLPIAVVPLLAAALFGIVRWPTTIETARVFDARAGLQERVATATELMAGREQGRFDLLQVHDAAARAQAAPRVALALRRRTCFEALGALLAALFAVGLALLAPRLPSVSPGETAPAAGAVDVSTVDGLARQDLPQDVLEAATPALVQAKQVSPADLANRVQQEQAEDTALGRLAQGLSNLSAGQAAAEDLQQGNYGAAADELRNLADNADQLSEAAKQQLARGLQDAAAASTQADPALAAREQQAAQALTHSTYADQRQALRSLADQIQRSGARSVPSDQLERDVGQLQQQPQSSASGADQNGAGSDQGQSAATSGQTGGGGGGQQGGPGVGSGANPNPVSDQPSRLDTAGQQVQVPTKLGSGPGVRPANGTEDGSVGDPSLSGRSVAELAQAQQTGQVAPEQNLVPGEQRPVVRGYFR
jgi:hypothetical protein